MQHFTGNEPDVRQNAGGSTDSSGGGRAEHMYGHERLGEEPSPRIPEPRNEVGAVTSQC